MGRYTYLLEATDSEGKTATDTVKIHVQQPREGRNYNHRFTALFKTENTYEYDLAYSLDWQVSVGGCGSLGRGVCVCRKGVSVCVGGCVRE